MSDDTKELDGAGDALHKAHFTPDDARAHRWWLCYGRYDQDGKAYEQEWEWFKNADAVTDFISKLTGAIDAMAAVDELMEGVWMTTRIECNPDNGSQPQTMPAWFGIIRGLPKNRQYALIQRVNGRLTQDILHWTKADYDAMKPRAVKAVARGAASAGLAKKRGVKDVAAAAKATPEKTTAAPTARSKAVKEAAKLTGRARSDAVTAIQEGKPITASKSAAARARKQNGGNGVSAALGSIKPKSQSVKRTPAKSTQSNVTAIVPRSQIAKQARAAKQAK
jgi:hypothetical protein